MSDTNRLWHAERELGGSAAEHSCAQQSDQPPVKRGRQSSVFACLPAGPFRVLARHVLQAVAWGMVTLVAAGASAAGAERMFDYRQKVLGNGLRVISLEDFSCPVVNVQLWYHVGSKDEQADRQGFAHMFEHMMFRGTDRLGPTDHFDLVRRTGGSCNAYTSFDQTVYHETLPATQLELALWLESERMAFLKIDRSFFDTERKVVEEERRMGMNRPFGTVGEKLMAAVFHEHPYRWTPIGQIPHLRAAAVQELRQFWTRYYVPNNATLVVAGAVKHEQVQQLAERYFGWVARGEDPPRVTVKEPPVERGTPIAMKEDSAPAPLVGLVFRVPPLASPDTVALDLLDVILTSDNSSRVYRDLVAERKLAVQVFSLAYGLEQDGLYAVLAIIPPLGASNEPALEALSAQMKRLLDEPVSEDELTKARNQLLKQTVTSTLTVEGKASVLGRTAVLEGDPERANQRLDDLRKTTAADLQRVARAYLNPQQGYTLTVAAGGKKPSEEDAPLATDPEQQAPPPGRPGVSRPSGYAAAAPISSAAVNALAAEHATHTLSNGLKVIVVPNREVPFVTAQLGLLAGAWTETKPGTASMTLGMLTKGTAKHSEASLAAELGQWAISLDGSAGMDRSAVVATCVSDQVERMLGLLSEVVLTPTFPPDEFSKHRQQVRTGLEVDQAQPAYQAQRELRRRLYGEHPYARVATGEVADVDALEVGDLATWWQRFARPDMAVLILAGDVDSARVMSQVETALGGWAANGPKPQTELPAFPAGTGRHIWLIDMPTSTQSQIHVGQLAIRRDDPRYFHSRVVNGYFGGAFNSRLNETIRVKKGLTYGARGGFSVQHLAGQFAVSTFTKTATTAETVRTIFEEIARLAAEPPSNKELDDTRSYLVGSFPIERETPQAVADDLWLIESESLPADYFEQELRGVAGTTADACQSLVRDVVRPDQMTVVVVGKAAEIQASLAEIAPVTVVPAP